MLNYKKLFIFTVLLISTLFSQSLLNGYGFGKKVDVYDSASLGISSTGLLPSFKEDVSLQNPSTWKNLNFTYFTGNYHAEQNIILDNIVNSVSDLGSAQLIVPIKNKYAFGIGLHPYFDQYLKLNGVDEDDYIAYGDTMATHHSYNSFGGATAFNISLASTINKYFNAAISFDYLYGSGRQQTVFSLDNINYYSQQRHIYEGSLAKIFIDSDVLSSWDIPVNLFFGLGFPVQSISVESYYYRPFEDSNNSGAQDNNDFPLLSNTTTPEAINTNDVSAPYEYQFGFDYNLKKGLRVLGEFSRWEDKKKNGASFSALNDQIQLIDHYSMSIVRFAPRLPKNIFDRFNYKIGTYSNNIILLNSKNNINEYGLSTGLSFKFGITKNQIDFAYSIGKRNGLFELENEKIQKFSIGITVGDIWFVKRRAQ